jgi:undecaprenyl-phosphate galactose phosphotransferase
VSISNNDRSSNLSRLEPIQMHAVGTLEAAAESRADLAVIAPLAQQHVPYALQPPVRSAPAQSAADTKNLSSLRRRFARAVKMAMDLGVAGIALAILAPLMLLIAFAVRLDGGPALFAHTRIGLGGRPFRCLKFRSMVTDSDAALQNLFASDPALHEEWRLTHKLRRDPRVTWIGRILRKTSLDELPQLLNILRLEMSLVGPRPIVSAEIPKYGDSIVFYYETRPGIAGLWQVSGRSDTTYAHRVHLDSWYVRNWTLRRDLAILLRTVPAVLTARGAG